MPCCDTGRNIQKYKGAAASTLQDALENGNTASLNINLSSPAVFIGDGGGLSNINASAVAGNLQAVTDNGAATTNKITLTNGLTSLVTSGNVLVTGNVTASFFRGDGGTLSNIAANKNFQEVTDLGATSSNKITLTNSATSLQTTGKIVSLTLEANVNASNIVTNDGRGINQLNASNVSIGTLAISRGGTGAGSASAAASALGVGTEDSPQFTAIELGHASDTTLARSSAGVVTIEGVEIRTGTVPVAKGGTGATSASAAASALGVGTEDSPQFTAIELGHASDTTLARSSAGVVTIEGAEIRTGTVPIGKGGTGQTTASAAASALGVGTEDSPQFTAIELGHATDTTLARSSAGVVTIEGAEIRTGTVARGDGGTGQTSYSTGDILYGASSGTTLNKLSPAGSNADVGKFLKLGDGDEPEWATVSVSSTTISTTDVTIEDTDHGLIFVSDSGTGVQALKKEYGTLKYKPSTGTLTTSNVITSDTSIHARNGIANTTPTHTLSVGTVVSIQETASGDVIIVRGNGYFSDEVYIAKKLTVPVGGEILADKITVRSLETKGSIVFANRPPTSGIVLG